MQLEAALASGSRGARSRARSAWLARLIHCPTAVSRSFPAAVNAQSAIAIRQARGSRRSSTTRIVFSSGARYRPASGSHGARSRARSAWLARLAHCPIAVNRSFPAAVNAQTAIAIRQASR